MSILGQDNNPCADCNLVGSCPPRMPLSFAQSGSTVRVRGLRGPSDLKQHLASLGLVEGAEVRVLEQTAAGLIVMVKGSRLALDRHAADRVIIG